MYTVEPLLGIDLPEKTLCLTYDDGPGEHTLAIASFLQAENIRATFFVVGKYAVHQTSVLAALQQMGHIIGNHTYEHPDLPYYVSINGDVQNQVLRTDAIIQPYTNRPIYFRAPYGKWSAEVANELNDNLLSSFNHIGPVHWEIGGIDCFFWSKNESVEAALESYVTSIREKKSGIVVMHDDTADMDIVKAKNKTLQLTQQLIPILKKEGYTFIGLDEIESFKTQASPKINLMVSKGECIYLNEKNLSITISASKKQKNAEFDLIELGNGCVALQAVNNCYLSVSEDNLKITAEKSKIEPNCIFHLIPVWGSRIILRTHNGHFLTREKNNQLTASAPYMRLAHIFTCLPLQYSANRSIGLFMKMKLWKKRVLFIKSKVLGT